MRRSVRVTAPPTRYSWDEDRVSFALVTETREPDNYREVIKADHHKWITTMEQEIESLDRSQTWTLVDLPKVSKVIGCRWVFRKNDNE